MSSQPLRLAPFLLFRWWPRLGLSPAVTPLTHQFRRLQAIGPRNSLAPRSDPSPPSSTEHPEVALSAFLLLDVVNLIIAFELFLAGGLIAPIGDGFSTASCCSISGDFARKWAWAMFSSVRFQPTYGSVRGVFVEGVHKVRCF